MANEQNEGAGANNGAGAGAGDDDEVNDMATLFAGMFKKLVEAQTQAATVQFQATQATVQVPSFSGGKAENFLQWLNEYERVTNGWSDDARKNRLGSALRDVAHGVFKAEVEPTLANQSWTQVKDALAKFFVPVSWARQYIEKLAQLKYDSTDTPLAAFLVQFNYVYVKAHPNHAEEDCVNAFLDRIPARVKASMAFMADLRTTRTVAAMKELAIRFDNASEFLSQPEFPTSGELMLAAPIMSTTPTVAAPIGAGPSRAEMETMEIGR